jgi:hypothetical protein
MINRTLMVLCVLVVLSYIFDLISKKTRIPSVLLLMTLGLGLQLLVGQYDVPVPPVTKGLYLLGTVGLILIVLEGAMDIHFTWNKISLIRMSFFSALFNLAGSTAAISVMFHYYSGSDYFNCLVNALPFAVVSSAIAIPSVAHLEARRKEFIVIESAICDIIGIMVFYFLIDNQEITVYSAGFFGLDLLATVAIGAGFCVLMFYIMSKNNHKIKFFLILAMLILIYAFTKKYFHLPALLIVFGFGLLLKNAHQIPYKFFRKKLIYGHYQQDFELLSQLTSESAFLVRTFFFIIFGYLIDMELLAGSQSLKYGALILVFIFVFRFFYNFVSIKKIPIPETLVNPRGLISILLFINIPEVNRIAMVNEGLLLVVIVGTGLVMTAGMMLSNLGRR